MRWGSTPLVFSELLLPRPLAAEQVEGLLLRLAADRAAPTIVLEARASHERGLQYLIGLPAEHARWARRTLRDLIPGVELAAIDPVIVRPRVKQAARVRIRPRSLALATDRPELVSLSVLSALDARLEPGESLVLQIALGPRMAPRHLPLNLENPTLPWWQQFLIDPGPVPQPIRTQIDNRSGQHGFKAIIRLGVTGATRERGRRLVIGLLGALSTAHGRNTYVDLVRQSPRKLNAARGPWLWPLRLGASELTGLLAWPIGDTELPGLPPLHPRHLNVPEAVDRTERVFATGGRNQKRSVGISARDSLGHLVAVGPTGSGKSTALLHLIKADIDAGRAVLVIDPKRQLIDDILDRAIPQERISEVVVIDPAEDVTAGFNPLDVGERDPNVVVDGLVAALAAVFHDGWGPRTQDIVNSGLLTLARTAHQHGPSQEPFTLFDLVRILTDAPFRRSIVGHVASDPGLSSFWAWYDGMAPAAQANAIAPAMNKLRQYLLRPSLRAILGQSRPEVRVRDMFRRQSIVLVPLNEGLIGPLTAQLLGSLIVAEVWSATLERAHEPDPTSRQASVFVDEVQKYLNLPTSMSDALAQSRSLGVGWHLAHQYRAQLTPELRAAVDSNAKSKLYFRPNDPDDARDMARQAAELEAIDFMTLGRFQAYANLTVDGAATGWCSVQTMAPPTRTGLGEAIRADAQRRAAARPTAILPSTAPIPTAPASESLGRKRRAP